MADSPSVTPVFDALPEEGTLQPVADGVFWLRMPLPFKLDHINLWLLRDGPGWTVVDTGLADERTRQLWGGVFDRLAGRGALRRVVATHFHPDHMGLAGWLCRRFGIPLFATFGEWAFARLLARDASPEFLQGQLAFHGRAGFDDARLDLVRARGNAYAGRVSAPPAAFRRLIDGTCLTVDGRSWEVIVGHGHSPEHACLYCRELDLLISGDQVLPRISPNVAVWPQEPDADPLGGFLDSLAALRRRVPGTVTVLPAHDGPFTGLHGRLDDLVDHHQQRLATARDACAEPVDPMALVEVLFDRVLDDHQLFFALGETLAHLHRLEVEGLVVRETDPEGVDRFQRV